MIGFSAAKSRVLLRTRSVVCFENIDFKAPLVTFAVSLPRSTTQCTVHDGIQRCLLQVSQERYAPCPPFQELSLMNCRTHCSEMPIEEEEQSAVCSCSSSRGTSRDNMWSSCERTHDLSCLLADASSPHLQSSEHEDLRLLREDCVQNHYASFQLSILTSLDEGLPGSSNGQQVRKAHIRRPWQFR